MINVYISFLLFTSIKKGTVWKKIHRSREIHESRKASRIAVIKIQSTIRVTWNLKIPLSENHQGGWEENERLGIP